MPLFSMRPNYASHVPFCSRSSIMFNGTCRTLRSIKCWVHSVRCRFQRSRRNRPSAPGDDGVITLVLENGIAHLRDASIPLKSIWPHRVFFAGDRPNEEAPLVIDATGGSRVLYYGPYFHLAEGRWKAKITLGFTKEAVGLPLKISAYGPSLLGEARVKPRQEGIFAAQFNFDVKEPEHPIEFHVRTEEGAIEGRIALGQVELSHLGRHRGKD